MIGLVVASHGRLATELVATAESIAGTLPQVAVCMVEPDASPEAIKQTLHQAIAEVDSGDGVIVFADLIGGSPCTQSLSLCRNRRIEVVTGVNLPMLLKAQSLRKQGGSLETVAQAFAEFGKRSIACASEALRPGRLTAV